VQLTLLIHPTPPASSHHQGFVPSAGGTGTATTEAQISALATQIEAQAATGNMDE